jgi:methylthioribose-1-phosphate isomerase
MDDGRDVPIEERAEAEVASVAEVRLVPESSRVKNVGFDVTPARLVTALITERGVCEASRAGLLRLFPERT